MRIELVHGSELDDSLVGRWSEIVADRLDYSSPYFDPAFTSLVSRVRSDIRVGLIHDAGRIAGFFPHHRGRGGLARPVGLGLSDYHGLITEPHLELSIADLFHGCKIVRYDFDHLPTTQSLFSDAFQSVEQSPIIEMRPSFEEFEASIDRSGRKQVREALRKARKLGEVHADIEYCTHSPDVDAFRTLLRWKSEQCQRTGTFDYLTCSWCRELLERIFHHQSSSFSGALSTYRAGGALVAAHFGMRSSSVWHSWIPAYDPDFQQYSPGSSLLVEMIRIGCNEAVRYIDLGKGVSTYKRQFMTSAIDVASGSLETPSVVNCTIQCLNRVESASRTARWGFLFRLPGGAIRRFRRSSRYR